MSQSSNPNQRRTNHLEYSLTHTHTEAQEKNSPPTMGNDGPRTIGFS